MKYAMKPECAVALSNHACRKRQLQTLLLIPTPSEAMDSVINDRRSIKLGGLAMLLIHCGRDFILTPTEIYDMKSNWRRI